MREKVAAPPGRVRLAFTIGGFPGPKLKVQWRRGQLCYSLDGIRVLVVPSEEDWCAFWSATDVIGVWGWQAQYCDLNILDGTQWALTLQHGVRRVTCEGDNAYPLRFEQLVTAVKALVRQPLSRSGLTAGPS